MYDIKPTIKKYVESTSIAIVLLLVFLPVRLLFVKYISTDWFGSFGLITVISIIILILARKKKLGWFGTAYLKQLYKANRGKRKYLFYTGLILGTYYFMATVYAINLGQSDQAYQEGISQIKQLLPYSNFEDLTKDTQNNLKIEEIPKGLLLFGYIMVMRFDIFVVLMSYMNDLSGGWILHFSTVFLIEELEIIGLLVLYKFVIKEPES